MKPFRKNHTLRTASVIMFEKPDGEIVYLSALKASNLNATRGLKRLGAFYSNQEIAAKPGGITKSRFRDQRKQIAAD